MDGDGRLDIYRSATGFLEAAWALAEQVPREGCNGALPDRLRRAALTIALDIATGSDGRRYHLACEAALECVGVLDALAARGVISADAADQTSRLLEPLITMLGRSALEALVE
jgi:hypothetical protein